MGAVSETRYVVQAGWDSVPHLDEETKRRLLSSIEPHLRDARTKGEPSMGSGTIYPIPWEEVSVAPFQIPDFWPRAYGMDVGWNRTAAIWGAIDRSTGTIYCTSEYYGAKSVPEVHAAAIKARGAWVSREGLLTALCYDQPDCDWPDIKIVDVRVCILRKKVSASIRTVHGEGYVIDRPADPLRHLANCQDRADDEGCGALIAALKRDDTAC